VLDVLIRDIIASSYDSDCIALSDEASASVAAFKDFNIHHIYKNGKLRKNEEKIRVMFRYLFDQILEDIEGEHEDSPVYVELINARGCPGGTSMLPHRRNSRGTSSPG